VDEAVDTHQYPGSRGLVLQTVNPVSVFVGLLDLHFASVAQELQENKTGKRGRFVAPNVRAKGAPTAWRAGRQAQNGAVGPRA
jgi:hypothetical protein